MPFVTRKTLLVMGALSGAAVLAAAGFVWSGVYNIAADDLHTRPVYALMHTMRERSITVRANKLHPPPNLDDPALIRQGAGNYNAMCMSCHLAPGMAETELSKGLYPAPPNLSKQTVDAASAFWVIKHGIKASGMPAWGKSMSDDYIWNMVAFLQVLPRLDAAQYQALVDSSGGHDHGGGETKPHAHAEGLGDNHRAPTKAVDADAGMDMNHDQTAAPGRSSNVAPEVVEHQHADGAVESHPAPPTQPQSLKADDGHDHQH